MRKFEEYYVAFWCLTMPITSLLLIPIVQGTIPAYMLAFGSLGFIALKMNSGQISLATVGYFKGLALAIMLWILLLCGSQLGDVVNRQLSLENVFLLSDETSLLFRSSMFTQSLYMLACVMIALYFRYFIQEAWIKYVYWGAWFLVIYGLYDWTFFLIFHSSGDFIANRVFTSETHADHPGSWSQTLNFGGLEILRLKSTLGEPSFFAAVVIPYLFLAIKSGKRLLAALLLLCALLSTSTTAILGLVVCFFFQALWDNKSRRASITVLGLVLLAVIGLSMVFPDMFNFLFLDKLSGDTESGRDRMKNIEDYEELFHQFGLLNWLFGVGFGYVYFSLVWSLTTNTGLLGLGTFIYAFGKPAYLLPREPKSEGLKLAVISILVVVAITLSELFIPTTWMFLGLAYRRLDQLERERELLPALRPLPIDLKPELSLTDSPG